MQISRIKAYRWLFRNGKLIRSHEEIKINHQGFSEKYKTLKFRPHHFLCALNFKNSGYSAEFIENFTDIVNMLRSPKGDETLITVVSGLDDICSECPYNKGSYCTEQAKIDALDEAHKKVLNLKIGEELTWGEAKQRIKKYMTLDNHNKACAKCGWLEYGLCNTSDKL